MDIDKLQDVQPDVLARLRFAVEANTRNLQIATEEGRISTVAWLTRNLLELMLWSEYCTKSPSNAKEFVLDSARDANDALDIPDGLFADDFSFRAAREELIQKSKADGFETLDESYTRVSKIAKDLGKGEVFKYLNKLLSKFAHPTALSIIYIGGQAERGITEKFSTLGMRMSEATLKVLRKPGRAD